MIIRYSNVVRVSVGPAEAYSPLIVNPDAVLSSAIANQFFQSISGWRTQIVERLCGIENQQFTQARTSDNERNSLYRLSAKETLRLKIAKAADHSR